MVRTAAARPSILRRGRRLLPRKMLMLLVNRIIITIDYGLIIERKKERTQIIQLKVLSVTTLVHQTCASL